MFLVPFIGAGAIIGYVLRRRGKVGNAVDSESSGNRRGSRANNSGGESRSVSAKSSGRVTDEKVPANGGGKSGDDSSSQHDTAPRNRKRVDEDEDPSESTSESTNDDSSNGSDGGDDVDDQRSVEEPGDSSDLLRGAGSDETSEEVENDDSKAE